MNTDLPDSRILHNKQITFLLGNNIEVKEEAKVFNMSDWKYVKLQNSYTTELLIEDSKKLLRA